MNFLATVNSFATQNETAVLFTVTFILVLLQLAFIVTAFIYEAPNVEKAADAKLDSEDNLLAYGYYTHYMLLF